MEKWNAIVGEEGSENGHIVGSYESEEKAFRAARRRAKKDYDGDGWYKARQVERNT